MSGTNVTRTGIYSKFTTKVSGDYVDLYTDLGGRLYYKQAPSQATYPYGVFQLLADKPIYWFGETAPDEGEDTLVQFMIYDDATNAESSIEGYEEHLHDLYDFCDLTISGYTIMEMRRVSSNIIEIEDVRQAMTTYRLKVDKD